MKIGNIEGLVLIGKGMTLQGFFATLDTGEPLPKIEYLVQDLAPGSDLKSITCWKVCDAAFDISTDVVDLVKSWRIHKAWHESQAILAPAVGNNALPSSFLEALSKPELECEVARMRRMEIIN